MQYSGSFDDESSAWTPRDSYSIAHSKLIKDNFPSSTSLFLVLITDKSKNNIVTKNHFTEINTLINDINAFELSGKSVSD